MPTHKAFIPRVPELLALEGWYDTGTYKFKLSCRFKDILRCSEFNGKTQHFISCFARGQSYSDQPRKYCYDPTWAIAYVPDKHGNFMGRVFVQWKNGKLNIEKVYGNRLASNDIKNIMNTKKSISCQVGVPDTYL